MQRRLHYPAPNRETVIQMGGLFSTKPWTHSGVLSALSAGAWFERNGHDFEPGVSGFAVDAQIVYEELVRHAP